MNRSARLVAVLAVAAAMLSTAGCNKLRARDQLNQGVKAYKNAQYEQAIGPFKDAVRLDDTLKVAKLYLATAYAQQYVPDAPGPEHQRNAHLAIGDAEANAEADAKNL